MGHRIQHLAAELADPIRNLSTLLVLVPAVLGSPVGRAIHNGIRLEGDSQGYHKKSISSGNVVVYMFIV
eukprot:scaffold710_cov171-Amphora_coffeaeformis.AAC.48